MRCLCGEAMHSGLSRSSLGLRYDRYPALSRASQKRGEGGGLPRVWLPFSRHLPGWAGLSVPDNASAFPHGGAQPVAEFVPGTDHEAHCRETTRLTVRFKIIAPDRQNILPAPFWNATCRGVSHRKPTSTTSVAIVGGDPLRRSQIWDRTGAGVMPAIRRLR